MMFMRFLSCLYESTGKAIALPSALALEFASALVAASVLTKKLKFMSKTS